jgi:PAS domain S-box-containing protein
MSEPIFDIKEKQVFPISDVSGVKNNSLWLNALIANLPQAILFVDDTQKIIITNTQFCRLFNIKRKPDDLRGESFGELFVELSSVFEDPANIIVRINNLTSAKKPSLKEHLHLVDGRILTRDYMPISVEGEFAGHMWTFADDTEKIKADILLNEQKAFYEDVLNNLPSDIAVFSPEHKYLFLNPVAVKDAELRKWLVGKTDVDYCLLRGKDMSLAEKRRNIFKHITESKKELQWEEKIINKQGEVEHHLRKMSPIYDENEQLKLIIGYGVNITERKIIEEKIQLSEKRYRDLFNYSQAIICTHDMQGNFLSVNPALLDIFGYSEEEVVGKNLKDFLLPEDRSSFDEMYLTSIITNNKVKGLFRILHKSGRKIYLLYQNYKVAESSDGEAYIIAFAQDVTDRIKAEKQLKEAKKVTEQTAKTKERFLANMSHEIRTPMNGILGITSLLLKTEMKDDQREYLNIVQDSAQNLLTIINDILDLEKVATGKVELEHIAFNIIHKLQTIVKLFEVNSNSKGVKLSLENHVGERLNVAGDPTRFNQIMNNLISNAIKFTDEGSIKIIVDKEKETEQFITLRFAVKDSGIGIDEDKLVKIFQPFTQAYPETSRKYGGTGLGLAITKNLIELQGGTIWVDSKPRKGSTFYFSITYQKCKEEDMQLVNPIDKPVRNDLGRLRVLLAEDNEVNQLLAKSILQYWGFDSEIATTGNEVLQWLNKENFDVILMDIQMPEKSGLEAAKEIRNLPDAKKRNIPIIALTANALKGEEKKYMAVGMNDYLTKPFKENELYEVISKVLRHEGSFGSSDHTIETKTDVAVLPEPTDKLYDLQLVNELARGNEEFIRSLIQIFLETIPSTSKEMAEACSQQNWDQTGKLAHKLKSTIDTMCITSIKEDIRSIEMSGKQKQNLESVPGLVKKVDYIIGLTAMQLKNDFEM